VPTVKLAGQVITGSEVSLTVTLKLQVEVLPDASVAVQVTLVVPCWNVEPEAGAQAVVTPAQLSPAVGEYVTTCEHWPGAELVVMLPGQVIVGAWLSVTVTLKLHEPTLPEESVTVQLTGVVPVRKVEPDAGTHTTDPTPEQLSLTLGE
jgi:hypothetical protein